VLQLNAFLLELFQMLKAVFISGLSVNGFVQRLQTSADSVLLECDWH